MHDHLNRGKNAFHKIQHLLNILKIQKTGIYCIYLNLIKVMYEKPTVNVILNGQKLEDFTLNSRKMHTLTTLSITDLGTLAKSNVQEK